MTILELRAELLARDTGEAASIAEELMQLPPYFTEASLRRVNAAYARGVRLMCIMPETDQKRFEIIS